MLLCHLVWTIVMCCIWVWTQSHNIYMTQFNVYIPGTTCLHVLLAHPCLYYYLLSPQYAIMHILLLIFILFLPIFKDILLCYVFLFFFALSIERTCPDLHFTTDYILYNWVCDEPWTLNPHSLSRLQLVQISAARLLTCTRRREHITPVLIKLHWFPVRYRIHYKV